MNINDIIRVQTGFKQTSQESKIGKKITEKVKDYNVIQELLGKKLKGKKGKNKAQETAMNTMQTNPAYNLSLSSGPRPPMWDDIWTKRERTMSDEEYEKAIVDLALEYADRAMEIGNSGKSASMIDKELYNLNKEFEGKRADLMTPYVSIVSPDRKAAYAQTDFQKNQGPFVYGNEPTLYGSKGNELMSWGPSGWAINMTQAELERLQKFNRLYVDTLRAYEAEHGQIPYPNPNRNYL